MTPTELIGLVLIIAFARLLLSLPPVTAASRGRSRVIAHEYLDPFIIAGIGAWFLITFVARTYYIPSGSMEPTLAIGDVLLVDKFEYRFHAPREGDVVVFPPPQPSPDDYIKRVIGLPGDTLRISGGTVYRNGQALVERYVMEKPTYSLEIRDYGIYVNNNDGLGWHRLDSTQANVPPRLLWSAPDRIPSHCYIMLGDNRNYSEDSHAWGFAQDGGTFDAGPRKGQAAGFTGRAFLIFWPASQARVLPG